MIKSLFNKYYRAIILQQEDKVQKLKQIFIKCTKGNDKAQARWQKNIAKKKVSIYNTEKKKVFTVAQDKFEKNPDRYIKYAEKFLPEEDDEELNDADVDKVVGKAKEKIQEIKKEQPKDAKEQLTAVYREVKTASPEAAKEIKSTVKDALTVVREKSTKQTTLSGISQASLVQAAGQLTKAAMKKEENDCSKYLEKK